ncbi:phosphatidylglycerol lysyltransferase domain-containing protein [Streptomyces sp. NPDC014894]|uniref:phosphatidylglycerol lysyltransferase domain-containing protein n=1 Tax=Streptomyces sp. NPDC014894 TaxID=3364931 RepID=UPI0036F4B928
MSVTVDGDKKESVPGRPGRAEQVRRVLRGPRPERIPPLAAAVCALAGLIGVAAGLSPAFRHGRAHAPAEVLPGATGSPAPALALGSGVLLLLLAHGLGRRKRRAWRAAAALLPLGAAGQFAYRQSALGVVLSLAVLALLVVHRREFSARSDPRGRRTAPLALLLMGAGSLGLGLLLVGAHSGQALGDPTGADLLRHTAYGLLGVEGPVEYAGDVSWTVGHPLGALGLLTAVVTVHLALRPERPDARLSEDDELRLRDLLARHGDRDSLGHFALRRDKSAVFSPSGKAAVCYRVVSGVMLASGDPVGDVEAWPGAIERFMATARERSWTPAVMGCSRTGAEVWTREAGLDALELGDEAVVDVADFSLSGRAMRNVRQMVNRIERSGYTTRVRRAHDVPDDELAAIRRAADEWRGTDTERGFSMALGRIGDPADGDAVIATAHRAAPASPHADASPRGGASPHPDAPPRADASPHPDASPHGDLKAIIHFVPWGTDGMSLELMRRDRSADPGMNELLIVAALRAAPGLKVGRVSLNFAMFRAALARGERIGAGPVLRLWRGTLIFLSRWFQIESLYKFNAKFRPRWEPRFVVFRKARDLPRIGFAAMRAEGFVTLPSPRPLPGRRAPRPRRPDARVGPYAEEGAPPAVRPARGPEPGGIRGTPPRLSI